MWRFIVMHSFYQFVVLAILLFFGAGTPVEKGGVFDFYSGIDADANETCHDRMLACQGNDPHNRSIEFELGTDECPTEQQCSAHFGVIFTAFVLMQLFNQINVRYLPPTASVLPLFFCVCRLDSRGLCAGSEAWRD